ncbi:helix-turn-helix domain-containing protein [Enterocloster clostridioformis]|uniref:helix-turn-helix domain-containing protein n=1 Tax=Enterocloster clostridioformis TaxID=1531 RepID=UPI00040C515B|nr:helix-turn-helix domain-containing protein [Enterocloster clostridioformis]
MELRTERKLSQKALTEQLQLAGFEKGTRFVPDYEVVALAEFFHVSCEYLLGV